LTNDSDMPIFGSNDLIAMKDYTKDGKMTLVSTCKATLENALRYLPEQLKQVVKLVDKKCPVLKIFKK